MNDSMFTKKEKEILSKMIGIDDLLDIEIATIMITKFPDIEELFYDDFDKMIEKYGEKTDILIKCLDIIWTEARE
ncbi:hypothetical protein P5E85_05745 [Clostridium perfringens]|uniref:hypothetical protein n=1 Tax=Clostridium perfringens TaxID=1502 RepID=UPI0013E3D4CF|nr:hypothetical protein [Clostridium perfringens]ELC8360893.1 hypothetical protein [Clostridium perfringens]MDK0759327.1 hypothetical protein [Clostridium perfringens]MDM1008279.1 hypothetical protein [Clostridium perfringens]NGT54877.1 hypothetical protein [Clostridium perfringens]UUR85210.1 hypothetical protein NQ193_06565 [Clostridium perfringens]